MQKRSRMKPTEAPGHLSERSKALWSSVVPRRAASPERLTLLQSALEALDRADEARELVKLHGMTSTTKKTGAVHVHPCVKIEREARQQFMKAWSELSLQWCMDIDGRMTR